MKQVPQHIKDFIGNAYLPDIEAQAKTFWGGLCEYNNGLAKYMDNLADGLHSMAKATNLNASQIEENTNNLVGSAHDRQE